MTKEQFTANNLFRFIGCGCQDECPKTKSEDDLYLVSLEYFGRYEDDDCNFTYMSAKDGSLHFDTWTTRCAAPHFNTFLRMTVQDAVAAGYMPKQFLDDYIEASWLQFKASVAADLTRYKNDLSEKVVAHGKTLNIPCTVSNRCRKYKGDGILIRIVRRRNYYYSYGDHYDYFAKVFGTDGKIYTVSANSVNFDMEVIKNRLAKMIPTIKDTLEFYDIFPMVNLKDELAVAVDVDHAAQMEKWYSRKAEKFPGCSNGARTPSLIWTPSNSATGPRKFTAKITLFPSGSNNKKRILWQDTKLKIYYTPVTRRSSPPMKRLGILSVRNSTRHSNGYGRRLIWRSQSTMKSNT